MMQNFDLTLVLARLFSAEANALAGKKYALIFSNYHVLIYRGVLPKPASEKPACVSSAGLLRTRVTAI